MGRFLNPDNSAFQVALNSEIYVDKTGLLEYTNRVMGTKQGYICNSRPRRFGKSITADMLTAYYSRGCSSREMFEKLNIGNMHMEEGKKQVATAVAVNKTDVDAFKKLQELGVKLSIQRVPSTPEESLDALFS